MEFSSTFSVEEVISFLKTEILITSEIEQMLRREQINGQTLVDLNDGDLRSLGFSTIRAVKEMQRLIMKCKTPENTNISNAAFCTMQQPFANLREKILEQSGGRDIIQRLDQNGYLGRRDQKIFVNICVQILVEEGINRGYKKNYPSTYMKVGLAKAITEEFPMLKLKLQGTTGYGHFYDPVNGTGFIENKLKTLRKQMPIEDKMYKKRSLKRSHSSTSSGSCNSGEDTDASFTSTASTVEVDTSILEADVNPMEEKITWLKQTTPHEGNMVEIYEAMKETHELRRREIQLKPMTLTAILEKYPRFCDADQGGLIEYEFEMNYPECKKFMEIFPPLVPNIIKLDQSSVHCEDDDLKAILILSKLLPPLNTKGKKGEEHCAIIIFQGAGCNASQYADTKSTSLRQPFLLAVGRELKPDEYFLIFEKNAVPVGKLPLLAFYRLFASFWIFGLEYYEKLSTFFNFFETIIFDMKPKTSVASLLAALDHV